MAADGENEMAVDMSLRAAFRREWHHVVRREPTTA